MSDPTKIPTTSGAPHAVPGHAPASPTTSAAASASASAPPRIRWLDLLAGLPALVIAVGMVATLVWQARGSRLEAAYVQDADRRLQEKNWHGALIDFKRLTTLDPNRQDYRLALAMVLEQLGGVARAEALARTLAPLDDRPGFAPAHLWLARRLMLDSRGDVRRIQAAEQHLLRFLKEQPKHSGAKLMLAELYALTGRGKQARPYFEEVAPGNPQIQLKLANLCRSMGDLTEAKRRADLVVEAARANCQKNPEDLPSRVLWANALLVKDDFEGALAALNAGIRPEAKGADTSSPGADPAKPQTKGQTAEAPTPTPAQLNAALRRSMALVCATWYDALLRSGTRLDTLLALVDRGLGFDPESAELLTRLSDMVMFSGIDPAQVRSRLETLLAQGRRPKIVHFGLGNDDWKHGRTAEARTHWEKAVEGDKPFPPAANNLAWSLAYNDPKDPARALTLIDAAVKQQPFDPRLRGTRGQVLTQLGRWKEAVDDLEAALKAGQQSAAMHEAAAETYEHLGMPEKVAEHRGKGR